jgi:hypothetical protein
MRLLPSSSTVSAVSAPRPSISATLLAATYSSRSGAPASDATGAMLRIWARGAGAGAGAGARGQGEAVSRASGGREAGRRARPPAVAAIRADAAGWAGRSLARAAGRRHRAGPADGPAARPAAGPTSL